MNPTIVKKRKGPPSSNLFSNYRGSRPMSTNGTLPIITVPSFCNFKEKFLQMTTNKKSTIVFNNPVESPTTQIKTRTANIINRPIGLTKQKSSLSSYSAPNTRPITSHHSFTQSQANSQFLYIVNTPKSSYQPINHLQFESRINITIFLRRRRYRHRHHHHHHHHHSNRFFRSLARLRRKQQQEQGLSDTIETKITLNLNRHPSTHSFQSSSNQSLTSLATDSSLMPTISMTASRAGRPLSSYRQLQRSIKTFRMNSVRRNSSIDSKQIFDSQLSSFQSSSLLITPRNSVVDDSNASTILKPSYDLHLSDDMLNYCYVSGDSGVKYQGQMFPAAF
ncbi:unnamed protein product [Rotaria socialis]|uniref:Uncharacterized protein n=1 Tax=Rotaria socialis TaxID=392032 RepID=A0A817UKX2_9BILA|nr:unnamed protein product [Rotaria socialis]